MNSPSTPPSMLRKVLAFFRRDVAIARSYRVAFALEILEAFFGVATFYYLSQFVSNDQLSLVLPAGSAAYIPGAQAQGLTPRFW